MAPATSSGRINGPYETEAANLGDTRGGEIRARPARDTDEETANIYAA